MEELTHITKFAEDALDMKIERNVYKSIQPGEYGPLPFTRTMVSIWHEDIPERSKRWAASNILYLMEDFCAKNPDKMHLGDRKITKDLINRTEKEATYYGIREIVGNIFYIESQSMADLSKELSMLEAPDVKGLLAGRIEEKLLDYSFKYGKIKVTA
jgi:hypothetical protein